MNYLEALLQTILAFTALFFYARLIGKQQIGQLTYFEYISGITIGSMAAELAVDIGPQRTLTNFLVLAVFGLLTYTLSQISLSSRPARKIIMGEPTIVVQNGKILERNMALMRYNLDELTTQLRMKNIFNLGDVEYAILEPNGQLSVLPKSQKRPLQPADLQIPTKYEGLTTEIILDGKIIFPNLKDLGLDEQWLKQELQKQGITNLEDISNAFLDPQGQLYFDRVEDTDVVEPTDISDNPKP